MTSRTSMKSSHQKKNSLHDIPGASRSIYSQRCSYISAIIFLAEFDRKGTEKIGLEHSDNAYETIPKGITNKKETKHETHRKHRTIAWRITSYWTA